MSVGTLNDLACGVTGLGLSWWLVEVGPALGEGSVGQGT